MSSRKDWVSAIERSYDLACDDTQWLAGIFEHAGPLLEGDHQTAWTFDCTPTTFRLGEFPRAGSKTIEWSMRALHRFSSNEWRELVYRRGYVVESATTMNPKVGSDMYALFRIAFARIARDVMMVGAHSGTGKGVVLATTEKRQIIPSPVQRKRWPQIAAHIGAGLRLRDRARSILLDSPETEAIFDPGGKLLEARGTAEEPSTRDRLRDALRKIDRARTVAGRSDPDSAMDAWEGLVDGRWSLVDRFDTDGRRFVVAVKNDPAFPDPRGLSRRERQVGEFVGLGQSSKEIAYTLGISLSAVTNAATSAMSKLSLSTRAELAAFFSPGFLRAKVAEIMLGDDKLLLTACPLVDGRRVEQLTDAEREVVTHLLAGSTIADIAERRGRSVNTVAAQIQATYRKLGIHSRSELAACLQAS